MTEQTRAATEAELRDHCDHVCLKRADHDGPHFHGYLLGPHSRAGLQREVDRLRAERQAVIDVVNLHGDGVLQDALDAIGFATPSDPEAQS